MPERTLQDKMDQADYITDYLRRLIKYEAVKGGNVAITLKDGLDTIYTEQGLRPIWVMPNGTWTITIECNGGARRDA